jgi:RNA polymerase-binding transcription factor DksA
MNGTNVTAESELSRIDVARIRQQLIAMREEMEASDGGRARLRLLQVEAALRKLDRGGYGRCEACAKPVIKARLLATPFVRYCVGCCS